MRFLGRVSAPEHREIMSASLCQKTPLVTTRP
jgi:hypothetical protein